MVATARRRRGRRVHRPRPAPPSCRRPPDPDACPDCGGELFWFLAHPEAAPERLCAGCVAFAPGPRVPPPAAADVSDLPPALRLGRKNDQLVYRIVRDLGRAWPADVFEQYIRRGIDLYPSKYTINHALTRLRELGLLDHDRRRGWAVREPPPEGR